jgi:hypothetical protein
MAQDPDPDPSPAAPPSPGATAAVLDAGTHEDARVPFLDFPPFPRPLPASVLPPIDMFVPCGILLSLDGAPDVAAHGEGGAEERDGLGVPTVRLGVRHSTVEGAMDGSAPDGSRKKKKKKKKGVLAAVSSEGRKVPWWDAWAEGEDMRAPAAPYEECVRVSSEWPDGVADAEISDMDDIERVRAAVGDFAKSRNWPLPESPVHACWLHVRALHRAAQSLLADPHIMARRSRL